MTKWRSYSFEGLAQVASFVELTPPISGTGYYVTATFWQIAWVRLGLIEITRNFATDASRQGLVGL